MIVRSGSTSANVLRSCGSRVPGGTSVTSNNAADEVRRDFDPLQQFVLVVHVLRERNVEHGPRRLVEREAREFRVAYDADDAEGAGVFRLVETEVLIERILVALEEALHERFVHDGDRLGGFVVGAVKIARAASVIPRC